MHRLSKWFNKSVLVNKWTIFRVKQVTNTLGIIFDIDFDNMIAVTQLLLDSEVIYIFMYFQRSLYCLVADW